MMTTFRNFHPGEAQVQAESGVDTASYDQAVDQPFQPELNESEQRFVAKRTFSVAGSRDGHGRPWASPLIGNEHELFTVEDLTTVTIRPRRFDGDPLYDNIEATGEMGVLYFNPAIRRRAKSIGTGSLAPDGSITYRMHRMFGLCPKYIFKRSHDPSSAPERPAPDAAASYAQLIEADRVQLAATDTIFLASHSEQFGTDPTHRGGPPGFVTVLDDSTVSIPDYIGNGMFQTLGNLVLDDRIGLMSLDFATGRVLQLTGRGAARPTEVAPGNNGRNLVVSIDEVRSYSAEIGGWTDLEAYELHGDPINLVPQ